METKRKKLDKVLKNLKSLEGQRIIKHRKRYLACGFVKATIDQHKLNNYMNDFYLCHCQFFRAAFLPRQCTAIPTDIR